MRKKTICALLSVGALTLTMAGCSMIKDDDIFGEYSFVNPTSSITACDVDEGVVLDGKAEEGFWQDEHHWFINEFSDGSKGNSAIMYGHLKPCEMRVTSHFTDKGVYFMAEMDDEVINVYRESYLQAHQKTGLSLYLATPGMTHISEGAYELVLAVDGSTLIRRNGVRLGSATGYVGYPVQGFGYAVDYRGGSLDENGNGMVTGYTMETFIPWEALKLDGKPEYLNVAFAAQRHENTTDASQFTWEWAPQGTAQWSYADTWVKFCQNGIYTADAQDKSIDANGDDWSDYTGEVKRLDYDDGARYIEHRMMRGSDGLYVYTDAVQNLYLTENSWYKNTSIEVLVYNKTGKSVSYALDGAGYKEAYTQGVMKAEDTVIGGTTYKHITAEYFIPDFALQFGVAKTTGDNIDVESDEYLVGIAFANGTGEKLGDDTFDPAKNESITPTDTSLSAKPWVRFMKDGDPWSYAGKFYVAKNGIGVRASDKTIDANADDWASYKGETKRINFLDGERYIEHKMLRGKDGLYVYTDAMQRLYLTENAWYKNTHIELIITNQDGGATSFHLDGAGNASSHTQGVMRAEDTVINGTTYKHITAEYFIPDFVLALLQNNVDTSKEDLRVGVSFCNGTGDELSAGVLDPATNEATSTTENMDDTCLDAKPYLFYPFASNPWDSAGKFYVTKAGITVGAKATDRVIDGNADDWADYHGVTAVAYGRKEGTDETSVGKGFEVKAVKGSDGVYFFATVKHSQWNILEKDRYDRSNLTLKFSVTDTAYTGTSPNTNGKGGWETYFTSTGVSWGANCAQYMHHSVDADGLHTTVIEGFVPFGYMLGASDYKDESTGKVLFNARTGELADGYVLRVGFRWRTNGDVAYMQTRNADDDWFTSQFSLNSPQNHYVVDANGLHQSRLVPTEKYVDGNADDWSSYTGETLTVAGTQANDARYMTTKAYMGADGLYTLTVAKVKNFVAYEKTTSGANGLSASEYANNSSLEIRYVDTSDTNAQFAFIAPSGTPFVTSWIPEIEYTYNVVRDGEYSIVTIEAFFNKNYLTVKTGVENPTELKLSFAYYVHDGYTGETAFAPTDYNVATSISATNGLYSVSEQGLAKELQ
ncbi:MAG: hypothetical protein IJ514_05240 [Clostridia bacterium]|nr:hypothetical protein [Clostridia bacterium]